MGIEGGKDIFVEWTPGNGFAETQKIAELIKEKGVRCLVGGQANQSASIRKVKLSLALKLLIPFGLTFEPIC